MKIFVSIVLALLVLIGGGSGYYIWTLTREINDLEAAIAQSLDDLSGNFSNQLETRYDSFLNTIKQTQCTIAQYADSANQSLADINEDIQNNVSALSNLNSKDNHIENTIYNSIIPIEKAYEAARKSIVSISDGINTVGVGFLYKIPSDNSSSNFRSMQIITSYQTVNSCQRYKPANNPNHPGGFVKVMYVTLYDGSTYHVSHEYIPEKNEIAILNIRYDKDPLPDWEKFHPVILADPDTVKPGDPVYNVCIAGYGEESNVSFKGTITTGVVSGIHRCVEINDIIYGNLIQFDAAVNFGGLGSPVFNKDGEVIGMALTRINPLIGDNIGFAIPINKIKSTFRYDNSQSAKVKYSKLNFPWTGITATDLSPEFITSQNNTLISGARVAEVTGPASSAGIRINDIITKLDNKPIHDSDEFYTLLAESYVPGDEITVEIQRNDEPVSIKVGVKEVPIYIGPPLR